MKNLAFLTFLFSAVLALFTSCSSNDDPFQNLSSEEAEMIVPAGAFKTRIGASETLVWVDDTTSLVWYYTDKRDSFYEKLTKLNAKVRNDTAENPFYLNPGDSVMCMEVTVGYKVLEAMEEVAYPLPFVYRKDPSKYGGISHPDLIGEIYCNPKTAAQQESIKKFASQKNMKDLGMQTWGVTTAYVLRCWKYTDGFILDLINELNKMGVGAYIPSVFRTDEYIPWRELSTNKLW